MNELKEKIHDDQNGLDYTLVDDYYIPDLKVSEHEETRPIGRWGHEHLRYIKEWRPIFYTDLAVSGDLGQFLNRKSTGKLCPLIRFSEGKHDF